jgi:apolipoprotein D and lipocalin family protein
MRPTARHLLLLGLAAAAAIALTARADSPPAIAPVASLDVPRYMGTWYEIAKYPNRFQKDCAGFTSATYRLRADKTVEVLNRCRRADGGMDEAAGTARQVGKADAATLKVRFAPAWLSFLPMVWGDYWVIDLDPGYRLAAVSDPRREYLWILSRTPTVPREVYAALLARLEKQGFDLAKLQTTPQAGR